MSKQGLGFSLREFLAFVSAFTFGLAALRYANQWWLAAVGTLAMFIVLGAAIVVVFDRGQRQVFALGYMLCLVLYGGGLVLQRHTQPAGEGSLTVNPEVVLYGECTFPTTILLRSLYDPIVQHWFIDESERYYRLEELPPQTKLLNVGLSPELRSRMGTRPLPAGRTAPTQVYPADNVPEADAFMRIGHYLWALMLSYAAAKFARYVYAGRIREQTSHTPVAAG
jgi:hypothetical protein